MTRARSRTDYATFLAEPKERILRARICVGRAVNQELIAEFLEQLVQETKKGGHHFLAQAVRESLSARQPAILEQPVQRIGCEPAFKRRLPTAKQLADPVREVRPHPRDDYGEETHQGSAALA